MPRFSADERRGTIRRALAMFHAKGTTGIYERHGTAPALLNLYWELRQANELRMHMMLGRLCGASDGARRVRAQARMYAHPACCS